MIQRSSFTFQKVEGRQFGALSGELKSRRTSIGDFDDLIACISAANGASIVSIDKHFN
jgi:predicted nucleic acid-binding protein